MSENERFTVLVGVGHADDEAAVRWAVREAAARGGRLVAIGATEPRPQRASYAGPPRPRSRSQDRRQLDAVRVLEDAVRDLPLTTVGIEYQAVCGSAARALIDRSQTADLLVLGARGGPGASAVSMTAKACLQHAACPVVIIPAGRTGTGARPCESSAR